MLLLCRYDTGIDNMNTKDLWFRIFISFYSSAIGFIFGKFPLEIIFHFFCKEVNWDKVLIAGMTRTSSSSTLTGQSPTGWECFLNIVIFIMSMFTSMFMLSIITFMLSLLNCEQFFHVAHINVIFIVLTVTSMINAISYQT